MASNSQPTPPPSDPAKIRARRRALGMRQVELAETAGISQGHISLIENGRRRPSADMLEWIAKALRCTVADLTPAGGDQ